MARIYLDHAASTPVDERVVQAMEPYLRDRFGNPSSIHRPGQEARQAIDQAREEVGRLLGSDPREILFTSGGTEANNLALFGLFLAYRARGKHLIVGAAEHHSVLHAAEALQEHLGAEVTVVPVNPYGQVEPEAVAAALRPDTVLCSVMRANNETGSLQALQEIRALTRERGIALHTDAVAAAGQVPIDVRALGVDALTLSAHKFYGPKGAGALFVRQGVRIRPLLYGGGQERGRRAGTENVPGIIGMGTAARLAREEGEERHSHLLPLALRLREGLLALPGVTLNGHPTERLSGTVHATFAGVEGQAVVLGLDLVGIHASTGSACASGAIDPSHVLLAMGMEREAAFSSVRFSLGRENESGEIEETLRRLGPILERLRQLGTAQVRHG